MSARDDQAIRRGGIICTTWVLILFTGAILLGITAKVYFQGVVDPADFDPETVLPTLATDTQLIPGILGGMLLAAILAAICSTADSQLLVSASAVSHDFIEKILGTETYPLTTHVRRTRRLGPGRNHRDRDRPR